jgi:hypothetical protein
MAKQKLTIDESIIILEKSLNKIVSFDYGKNKTDFILDIVNEYKQLLLHIVVQAKPKKANVEVLAIMGTLVRTLSRLDNNNPNLLLEVDKKRLLKGKETISEWCKIDPKDIPNPSSL